MLKLKDNFDKQYKTIYIALFIFLFPLIVLTYFFVEKSNQSINFVQLEIDGVKAITEIIQKQDSDFKDFPNIQIQINKISEEYKLILDPHLDTYHLAKMITEFIPYMVERALVARTIKFEDRFINNSFQHSISIISYSCDKNCTEFEKFKDIYNSLVKKETLSKDDIVKVYSLIHLNISVMQNKLDSYLEYETQKRNVVVIFSILSLCFGAFIILTLGYRNYRLQNNLKSTNLRQEKILEAANLGSWDWNLITNEFSCDDRWFEMIGLNPKTTEQNLKTWKALVHPDDKRNCILSVQSYLKGQTSNYENIHRLKHANGNWLWILDRAKISERDSNGNPIRLTGIHLDISKQKTLEHYLETAQHVAKIGNWSYDVKTQKIEWSKQMFELFNENINDGPPTFEKHQSTIHPDDLAYWNLTVQKCLQDGKPYKMRFRSIFEDKVIWIEAIGHAQLDSDQKVSNLFGTCQDVSEKVETEIQLEHHRIKTLQSARLASLGEMSAGVAHEINNPLAIIKGSLHLLVKAKDSEEKFNRRIEVIDKAILRISKIVNGLLKFSRQTNTIEFKSSSLNVIVSEAVKNCEDRCERNGISIKIETETEIDILCDQLEIQQVLINLINNSIDAIKNQNSKWILIKIKELHNKIYLIIMDSGRGINKEIEEKMFQPFFTTKPIGEGTGLGLSITKGILDNHKAVIQLNHNHANTCFEIIFDRYSYSNTKAG